MRGVIPEANPFQPGAGVRPPLLAGRGAEQALGDRLLALLESGRRPSQGLLFFGPRGNGKTSLLDDISDSARRRGIRAEDLSVSSFATHEVLVRRLQEKAGGITTRVQNGPFTRDRVPVPSGPLPSDAAELLAGWIGTAPLVVLLDEAHAVPPATGRVFLDAVQSAARRELPFVVLAAGTPDAPRRLRTAGTFAERMFRQVPVGRLHREATLRALTEPAASGGLPFTEGAAAWLAEQSRDYPYFIQLLGRDAWNAAARASAPQVTLESARKGAAEIRPEIERFHAGRFQEAHGRGVHHVLQPLARLVSRSGGRLAWADLDGFLADYAPAKEEAELLQTLTDLGVLWETPPTGWEMGIPSFADFLLSYYDGHAELVARMGSHGTHRASLRAGRIGEHRE